MADIKIYASDYTNLNETLSEKNIINTVYGKEYVVVSIEDTELNSQTINPQTVSKMFNATPYTNSNSKYNSAIYTYYSKAVAGLFSIQTDVDWARTETLFYSGNYEFTTNEVIDFGSAISCKFIINYTKSMTDSLNDSLYNKSSRTVFFGYGGQFPMLRNSGDDNLSSDKFLDAQNGTAIAQLLWAKAEAKAQMPNINEYCYAEIVNKTSSSTTIKVNFRFKIWAGWSTDNQSNNTVLSVNNITIKTYANTIDTNELEFEYNKPDRITEKPYQLETNELFQTELTTSNQDKLSYQTFQEITNEYNIDKKIISFDLLNVEKYIIDDTSRYTNGKNESRYLDVDDVFDFYGIDNQFVGTFKIIQCNPIWDGSYFKRVVAIFE